MVKIYESPDGGNTIFERDTCTGTRVLIEEPKYPEWYLSELELSEIVDYANEGNKSLQIQLKKLKLMYNLIKERRW